MQLVEKNVGKIIESIKFENGVEFKVGEEYFDYDGMTCVEIRLVPEDQREEDEVVEVYFKDGSDGMACPFDKDGNELFI